jgi:NAD(P)-dependent dehydrogenase (short-subunit alcohol dehydrogenase family)
MRKSDRVGRCRGNAWGRTEEKGELAATQIRSAGGKAEFCKADVKIEKECAGLVKKALGSFGRVDGLVNNAGWFPRGTLEETTTELWEEVMQVNLRGSFYCCKHAGERRGKHCKYGIDLRDPSLAESRGVRCGERRTAIADANSGRRTGGASHPSELRDSRVGAHRGRSGAAQSARPAGRGSKEKGEKLALGRQQTPLDTAYAVVYLLSDESAQVTGSVLHVDAGASTLPIEPGKYPG